DRGRAAHDPHRDLTRRWLEPNDIADRIRREVASSFRHPCGLDTWRHVRRVACWKRSGVIPHDIGAVAVSPEDVGAAQAALEIRAPAHLAAGAHGQHVWGRLCDRISRTE